jgi:AmmeMemoRadiSam system protein A
MDTETGHTLVALARAAIALRLGHDTPAPATDITALRDPGATFVTLMHAGKLRGCIGTLEAHRPLAEDVTANAVAAAFKDPRFEPLTRDEFADVEIEVSLLSAAEPLPVEDEAAVLAQLRPGIDGVIFEYGRHRSTFLPQVWEQLTDPAEFMAQLKYKAGLPPDFWSDEVRLARYTVSKWREADLRP